MYKRIKENYYTVRTTGWCTHLDKNPSGFIQDTRWDNINNNKFETDYTYQDRGSWYLSNSHLDTLYLRLYSSQNQSWLGMQYGFTHSYYYEHPNDPLPGPWYPDDESYEAEVYYSISCRDLKYGICAF